MIPYQICRLCTTSLKFAQCVLHLGFSRDFWNWCCGLDLFGCSRLDLFTHDEMRLWLNFSVNRTWFGLFSTGFGEARATHLVLCPCALHDLASGTLASSLTPQDLALTSTSGSEQQQLVCWSARFRLLGCLLDFSADCLLRFQLQFVLLSEFNLSGFSVVAWPSGSQANNRGSSLLESTWFYFVPSSLVDLAWSCSLVSASSFPLQISVQWQFGVLG